MYKRINELLGTNFKSASEINRERLCVDYKLSEDFIREFRDEVDWRLISRYQVLSESFIREFKDKVIWGRISQSQILSESFIREFKDEVNWGGISSNQILSESFIKEFKDRVNWNYISNYQTLSESFIREFKDKVDWYWISHYQILSWNFILEFEDRVSWYNISSYQLFIEDIDYEKIDKEVLKENKLYHFYQQTKEKGWFIGYVDEKNRFFNIRFNINKIKSRVYWKDLVMTNKVNYFEPIRQLKNV